MRVPSQWMIIPGNGSLEHRRLPRVCGPGFCRRVCGLVLLILRDGHRWLSRLSLRRKLSRVPGHGHHVDRSWRGLAAHLGGHGSQLVARQRRDRMAFCWVVGAWPCLRGCRCGLALIDVGFCVSRRRGFGRRGIRTGTGSARRGRWPIACSAVAARCARRPGDGNRCCRSSRVGRGCRH